VVFNEIQNLDYFKMKKKNSNLLVVFCKLSRFEISNSREETPKKSSHVKGVSSPGDFDSLNAPRLWFLHEAIDTLANKKMKKKNMKFDFF